MVIEIVSGETHYQQNSDIPLISDGEKFVSSFRGSPTKYSNLKGNLMPRKNVVEERYKFSIITDDYI